MEINDDRKLMESYNREREAKRRSRAQTGAAGELEARRRGRKIAEDEAPDGVGVREGRRDLWTGSRDGRGSRRDGWLAFFQISTHKKGRYILN